MRGEPAESTRTITFTSTAVTIMITVTALAADRVRLDGWVAPGAAVRVEVRTTAGTHRTVADDDGRFVIADLARGLVQLMIHPAEGADQPPVVTPSIEI